MRKGLHLNTLSSNKLNYKFCPFFLGSKIEKLAQTTTLDYLEKVSCWFLLLLSIQTEIFQSKPQGPLHERLPRCSVFEVHQEDAAIRPSTSRQPNPKWVELSFFEGFFGDKHLWLQKLEVYFLAKHLNKAPGKSDVLVHFEALQDHNRKK